MRSTPMPRSSSRPAGAICNATKSQQFCSGMTLAMERPVTMNDMSAPMSDGHLVQYYEKEGFLYERVTDFMSDGLRASDAAILIATRAHRDGVESRLLRRGVALPHLTAGGRYHPLDAQETLSRFMVDGRPDPYRFPDTLGPVIRT